MKVMLSAGMIQGGRSGVGRYVIELAQALLRGHPEVELHLAGLDADRGLFAGFPDGRWVPIPARAAGGAANLLWHQTALDRIARGLGCDLIHIPSYRRMLFRSSLPQVATIHDCAPFVMRGKYDFARGFFGRGIVPCIARRVDHILAVSGTTRADILRYMKVPAERVSVVPNGIDHAMFRPPPVEAVDGFRRKHGLNKPFFLYVARLEHPAKNHLRLIHAFEKTVAAGAFEGLLVLPGAAWHGSEIIERAVEASPCRSLIRLEGFVDNVELPLWYAAAEALVFPSLMEGFGLPLLEAQACGTRIACADATSLPEVAGPAGLLFDGTDVDSIASSLARLAGMDAGERAERVAQGIGWAGRFTWDAHAAAAVEIYRRCLQHPA